MEQGKHGAGVEFGWVGGVERGGRGPVVWSGKGAMLRAIWPPGRCAARTGIPLSFHIAPATMEAVEVRSFRP